MLSVTEESKVCIKDEIYDFISCTNVETVAVPINCRFCGTHSVKHKILKFSESIGFDCHRAGIFECGFVHESKLTDFGGSAKIV